jgi:hypothetical protein
MLHLVVARCADMLVAAPNPVLPADRVGARRPAASTDLPALAISLTVEDDRGSGLGPLTRRSADGRDVSAERYRGLMTLELWAADDERVVELAALVQRRLRGATARRVHNGFLSLQPALLEASERVSVQTGDAAFPAWRQTLAYRFVCEVETEEPEDEGGAIRRVDVTLRPPVAESFTVPPA